MEDASNSSETEELIPEAVVHIKQEGAMGEGDVIEGDVIEGSLTPADKKLIEAEVVVFDNADPTILTLSDDMLKDPAVENLINSDIVIQDGTAHSMSVVGTVLLKDISEETYASPSKKPRLDLLALENDDYVEVSVATETNGDNVVFGSDDLSGTTVQVYSTRTGEDVSKGNISVKFEPDQSGIDLMNDDPGSNPAVYRCPICNAECLSLRGLKQHQRSHVVELPYVCENCNLRFENDSALAIHELSHNPHPCPHCSRSFQTSGGLSRHVKIHAKNRLSKLSSKETYASSFKKPRLELIALENDDYIEVSVASETKGDNVVFSSDDLSGTTVQVRSTRTGEDVSKGNISVKFEPEHSDTDVMNNDPGSNPAVYKCQVCDGECLSLRGLRQHQKIHIVELPYSCSNCKSRFANDSALAIHELSHNKNNRYPCPHCTRSFEKSGGLSRHIKMHAQNSLFRCSQCVAVYNREEDLIQHQQTHDTLKKCIYCVSEFRQQSVLDEHVAKNHSGGKKLKVKCTFCESKFYQQASLLAHMEKSHADVQEVKSDYGLQDDPDKTRRVKCEYRCKFCESSFDRQSLYTAHLKSVHSDKLRCPICGVLSENEARLHVHLTSHIDERPYRCTVCPAKFKTNDGLKRHTVIHSGTTPKFYQQASLLTPMENSQPHVQEVKGHNELQEDTDKTGRVKPKHICKFCASVFDRQSTYRAHLKSVHPDKFRSICICPVCSVVFENAGRLRTHMITHSDERPFSCTVCSSKFKTRDGLRRHTQLHSGMRPFKCFYCDKSFKTKDTRTTHERLHTGEKPYKCSLCEMRFMQNGGRDRHEATHSGAYDCSECSAKFLTWDACKKHKATHAVPAECMCTYCGQAFENMSSVRKHESLHRQKDKKAAK